MHSRSSANSRAICKTLHPLAFQSRYFYKPLYVCEVSSSQAWQSSQVGTKDKGRNTTERDFHAYLIIQQALIPTEKLLRDPVGRQLSTSKWGKCLSIHLLSFSLSPSFFFWCSLWGLLILRLDDMPTLDHLIPILFIQRTVITYSLCSVFYC